jgi:hypothetical protein
MNPRIVIAVACLGLSLGGCATTWASRENASNDMSASPATTANPSSDGSNFVGDTIPDYEKSIEAP